MDPHDGFAEFVRARRRALSRTAYLLTGDHQLAEDLLQTALAKTARHWRRIRDGNPEAYVRRVLYTEQVSWWRRRRLIEYSSASPPDRPDPDPAGDAALRLTLRAALAHLTPRQRAVLVLRFFEDRTEADTADVLGCSIGTVKSQTHAALTRLRMLAPGLGLDREMATAEVTG